MRGPDWGLDVAARLADCAEKVTRKARKSRKCFSEHELSIRQHAEYADGSRLRRKKGHTESTEITEMFF